MNRVIRHIFFILLISFVYAHGFAQDDDYSRDKEKPGKPKEESKSSSTENSVRDNLLIGGGIGLQFGNPTYIEVSPKIAYYLSPKSLVGGGVLYRYYHYEDNMSGAVSEGSDYGGSVFTSYEPFRNIFGWVEFEILNFERSQNNGISDPVRVWVLSPLVGIGYRQKIGSKGFFQLTLLYNLNFNTDSPYANPIIPRISIFF